MRCFAGAEGKRIPRLARDDVMPIRPFILSETTWKTVDATPYELAILPWGATEAHNYHLPYATDTILSVRVAAAAAQRAWTAGARVLVLPSIPFGVQTTRSEERRV